MEESRMRALGRGVAVWAAAIVLVSGCAPLNPPAQRRGDQPFDRVYIGTFDSADPATRSVETLPRSAYKRKWFFLARPRAPHQRLPHDKIDPVVRQWMASRPPTDRVRLIVTYVDRESVPRFPRPDTRQTHAMSGHSISGLESQHLVSTLDSLRGIRYVADTTGFAATYGAAVFSAHWLIQATLVEMPLGRIDAFSRQSEVIYIRSNRGGRPPTDNRDSNPHNNPKAARTRTGTDHYFDLDLGYGWMALLDTGVRITHDLLSGASRLCVADCLTGPCAAFDDLFCPGGPTSTQQMIAGGGGDVNREGHGTSSAAILTANDAFGDEFRGVTSAWLDCFRVYDNDNYVDVDATIRAFELAVLRLNQVIVAEIQETTPEFADVGAAAERAYQAGAVVIAANGNDDHFVAGQPAQGSHVIGVGSYDLEAGSEETGRAWGLSSSLRVKPDVLGPTSSETAGNERSGTTVADQELHYFGATSGATPYVGGAANLLRNWMNVGTTTAAGVDPGQVYAGLILAGDRVGPFVVAADHPLDCFVAASPYGAGRLGLPPSGTCRFGKAWVSANLRYAEIAVPIASGGIVRLEAAIWWPDPSDDDHNEVDLKLIAPNGTVYKSASPGGVFERARAQDAAGLSGTWHLRICPKSIGPAAQAVYWATAQRKDLASP